MFPHLSPAFRAYIAPAQERSEIWRTILGFVLLLLLYVILVVLAGIAIYVGGNAYSAGHGDRLVQEISGMTTTFATSAALLGIIIALPPLWLVLRFLHKRPLTSLLGPSRKIDWRLWRGAALIVLVLFVVDVVTSFVYYDVNQQFSLLKWTGLLLPGIVLIFLQTTTEELVFRGYLQQQLAARFKNPLIWWLLPSVLFGLAHYDPETFGQNTWLIIGTITVVGLILADVTARFGSLAPAMGLHFANNAAMLFISTDGNLSGYSLFVSTVNLKSAETGQSMAIYLGVLLLGYLIFMLIMRRRRL
ncbi:MAG: CPBP family intramembrane glutamic endopeptidase [Alphaproteobacteria bacterium]